MAICAGCNTVYPWAGFVIGLVAGLVFMTWSFMLEKLKIDDPLDAVAGIDILDFFLGNGKKIMLCGKTMLSRIAGASQKR